MLAIKEYKENMNKEQKDDILSLTTEDRYDYFLSYVGVEREIWVLINKKNEFLKNFIEDDRTEYLPVWPTSEYAVGYAGDTEDLHPKSITLPEFFNKWVPGLDRDGLAVGVFADLEGNVWLTEPAEVKSDLQSEICNF